MHPNKNPIIEAFLEEIVGIADKEYKTFWVENDLPQQFVDTPEWTKITIMAKEILVAFDHQY